MHLRLISRRLPLFILLPFAWAAQAQVSERSRLVEVPLASTHADITFTITSGSRIKDACDEGANCPDQAVNDEVAFVQQVKRIATVLQAGSRTLYPDLRQRVPSMRESGFEVYVVKDEEPGSTSSANGRIALNSALGTWRPYDESVAFIIAREMGHVIARHHQENSAASITTSVLMNILVPGSGLLKGLVSMGGSRLASTSKRDVQAVEADAIALNLLKVSGFRLENVSLSLRATVTSPGESVWMSYLRKSSDALMLAVGKEAQFVVADVEGPSIRAQVPIVALK